MKNYNHCNKCGDVWNPMEITHSGSVSDTRCPMCGNYQISEFDLHMPWIFRIDFTIAKWFKFFHTTRGANFMEIHLWFICISIGMPWLENVLVEKLRTHGNLNTAIHTNDSFNDCWYAFQIGKYKTK